MKFKLFTAMLLGLFALGACNDDNEIGETPTPEAAKGFAPKIIASVAQAPLTRAGVIEDNDYTINEKFYWVDKDQTNVYFSDDDDEYISSSNAALYTASVADGAQQNSCNFATASTPLLIADKAYTVHGFYPAKCWGDVNYSDEMAHYFLNLTATLPVTQTQTDRSSKHLGDYMLMKAQTTVESMNEETSINLQYKHMASVFRFAVANSTDKKGLKLRHISMSLKSNDGTAKKVFGTSGNLARMNTTSLTIEESAKRSTIGLSLTGAAQSFIDKDDRSQCEGYMVVLPTATDAFADGDRLVVEFTLVDTDDTFYTATQNYEIGEGKAINFLSKGIEQGKSYYIQQVIETTDLVAVATYAVGDYYPDPKVVYENKELVSGIAATGIVYWLDNPVSGKSDTGKIVSLYEGTSLNWSAAKTWCTSKGTGWLLPSRDELQYLYCAYNGKTAEKWGSAYPPFPEDDTSAACTAFNSKLSAAGGPGFSSNWYWSSSEDDNTYAWIVNFNDANTTSDDQNSEHYSVRAVSAF